MKNYKVQTKELFEELCMEMKIKKPPFRISGGGLNAFERFGRIIITKDLAKMISTNYRTVRYLLTHELIHLKYQDSKTRVARLGILAFSIPEWIPFEHRVKAYTLLTELRASIEGYSFNKYKEIDEIIKIENSTKDPKFFNKEIAYKYGYPSTEQIANYASKYEKLTEELAREVLNDFCMVRKIKDADKDKFINKTLARFRVLFIDNRKDNL
ncbi:hypothetical protein MHH81_20825 [Psychrobacillus sp. FSL H8-0484]|uniref:hypothetical protein n=1 Tax=Psychrobacillus sp. FSL H8-0484 TaxID=2921390 RepID=UPI0030F61DCD